MHTARLERSLVDWKHFLSSPMCLLQYCNLVKARFFPIALMSEKTELNQSSCYVVWSSEEVGSWQTTTNWVASAKIVGQLERARCLFAYLVVNLIIIVGQICTQFQRAKLNL